MRILIVRNDKLGDFTLSLPVFHAIKEYDRSMQTIALVSPMNADFAQQMGAIDDVIVDDKKSILNTCKAIRKINPHVAITLYSTFRIGLLLFLSGIKKRIAPATKAAQVFYNHRILQRRSQCEKREYEYNLDLLMGLDDQMDIKISRPVISVAKSDQKIALESFKRNHGITEDLSYVVIHPGYGGSSLGLLSTDEYIELGRIVSSYKGIIPVFTFGPDEENLKARVEKKVDYRSIVHISKGNAYEFCKLISNFSLFISTSTGTMQLAGAVNIPTMSFFGDVLASSPARWAPLNSEDKQINITLPVDSHKRREVFVEVKNTLRQFIDAMR